MNRRLHWLIVVVLRRHLDSHGFAALKHITRRLNAHAERSICRQHRGVPADFAIRRVGHARLYAVILVVVLAIDCDGQRNREPAIGVQHAFVLLLLGFVPARFGVVGGVGPDLGLAPAVVV